MEFLFCQSLGSAGSLVKGFDHYNQIECHHCNDFLNKLIYHIMYKSFYSD